MKICRVHDKYISIHISFGETVALEGEMVMVFSEYSCNKCINSFWNDNDDDEDDEEEVEDVDNDEDNDGFIEVLT